MCQPVLALDDPVRTLQQDLRTQPFATAPCVLITASTVQHAETVLVGLAPRYHGASARNIPHVNLCQTTDLGGCPRDSSSGKSVFQIVYFSFLSFAFHLLSRLDTVCFAFYPAQDGRVGERQGRSSLKFVSSSSSADPALVGSWRLCHIRAKTTWNITSHCQYPEIG